MGAAGSARYGPRFGTVRIVHAGGRIEEYRRPVAAAEIMLRHPRHYVATPDVFRCPSAVLEPDVVLMPGNKFFLVPFHTVLHLLKKEAKEARRNAAAQASAVHVVLKQHSNATLKAIAAAAVASMGITISPSGSIQFSQPTDGPPIPRQPIRAGAHTPGTPRRTIQVKGSPRTVIRHGHVQNRASAGIRSLKSHIQMEQGRERGESTFEQQDEGARATLRAQPSNTTLEDPSPDSRAVISLSLKEEISKDKAAQDSDFTLRGNVGDEENLKPLLEINKSSGLREQGKFTVGSGNSGVISSHRDMGAAINGNESSLHTSRQKDSSASAAGPGQDSHLEKLIAEKFPDDNNSISKVSGCGLKLSDHLLFSPPTHLPPPPPTTRPIVANQRPAHAPHIPRGRRQNKPLVPTPRKPKPRVSSVSTPLNQSMVQKNSSLNNRLVTVNDGTEETTPQIDFLLELPSQFYLPPRIMSRRRRNAHWRPRLQTLVECSP